jgi:predicted metal-dependent peptidase
MDKINKEVYEETMANTLWGQENQYVFYGHIIAATKVHFDNTLPAPAGVYFAKSQFNLVINLEKFSEYSLKERRSILVHEALHIILNHIGRAKNKRRFCWNIATDTALNQFIKDLPPDCMLPEKFGLEPKLSAENYYSFLRKKIDDKEISFKVIYEDGSSDDNNNGNPQQGNGKKISKVIMRVKSKSGVKEYEIDPHVADDRNEGEVNEELVNLMREKLIQHAENKSRGLIPSDIADEIEKLRSKKIDWKKHIRNQASNSSIDVEESIKRRNRRFMNRVEIKGFIKTYSSKGVVILDTSGSVSNEFISKTLGEIDNLCKSTNSEVELIQVDAQVHSIKKYTPSNKKVGIVGRGGTYLYPAIEHIKNKKIRCDYIIVLTDGEIENSWKEVPQQNIFFLLPKDGKLALDISNFKKAKVFNID